MKPRPPLFRGATHTARTLALQVLLDGLPSSSRRSFVQETLDRRLGEVSSRRAERRLATQLVYGILRQRGTLDALLRPLLTRSLDNVEPWLLEVLHLGAFQLAFLDQVPVHAALHETVELVAQFGRPAAKGFVNGILRASHAPADRPAWRRSCGRQLARGGRSLPSSEPGRLPQPRRAPGRSTWPRHLVCHSGWSQRWLAHQPFDECLRLGFWFVSQAPLTLRCNPLRVDRATFVTGCAAAGFIRCREYIRRRCASTSRLPDCRHSRLRRGLVRGAGRIGHGRRVRTGRRSRAGAFWTCVQPPEVRQRTSAS